jgi:NADH-quinone oxidoreductase subunit J
MLDLFVFYIFAGLAVISALLMVTRRNVVHSAIFLATALLATAGIFLSLNAEFLFIVQIILYTGGIMVLYVFVIMLVNLDVALHQVQFNRKWYVAALLAVVLGLQAGAALLVSSRTLYTSPPAPAEALEPNTEQVAWGLFHTYLLPFEIASILLLVAMIGGVVMAKKRLT